MENADICETTLSPFSAIHQHHWGKDTVGGKLSEEEEEEGEGEGEAVLAGVGRNDWLDCLGLTILTVDFYYFSPSNFRTMTDIC